MCIGIYNEKENLGFSDFLSSDNSGLDAFIEKKLEKSGHSLKKENNTHIKLNPESNYIIKKNKIVIELNRGNIKTDGSKSKNYFVIDDPKRISTEGSWTYKNGVQGGIYKIHLDKNSDIEYAMFLVKQKYKIIIN